MCRPVQEQARHQAPDLCADLGAEHGPHEDQRRRGTVSDDDAGEGDAPLREADETREQVSQTDDDQEPHRDNRHAHPVRQSAPHVRLGAQHRRVTRVQIGKRIAPWRLVVYGTCHATTSSIGSSDQPTGSAPKVSAYRPICRDSFSTLSRSSPLR